MSKIFARFLGFTQGQPLTYDAAVLMLERHSPLSRSEARVLVLDYLGVSRDELSEQLDISIETIRTYWKRMYRKTRCRTRTDIRGWLEATLQQELGDVDMA